MMTKIKTMLGSFLWMLLFLMLAPLFAAPAFAATGSSLNTEELNRRSYAKIVTYDTEVAMNITYVGSSTQAVVYVGTGAFITYVPGPAATQDLSYDLSNASYDTMGELCDAIDDDSDYECSLSDAKRDDSSLLLQQKTLSNDHNAKASGGFDVKIDSGGVQAEFVDGSAYIMRLGITPATGNRVILKYCIGNFSGTTDTLRVWGKLAKYANSSDGVTRNDTTLVYKDATAEDTDKTVGNIYGVPFIEFAKDEHVVIGSYDNDTAQSGSTNQLSCVWDEK